MTGTPYGIQPFAAIRPEHYLPALEAVLSQREARVRAIAQNPDPPGFANTVEALELSGGQLQYLHDAFTHQVTAGGCAELAAVEQDFAVRLSRHEGRIVRNRQLATRIEAVYAQRGELDAQPAALVEFWRRRLHRAGAMLDSVTARELGAVNRELSRACAAYRQELIRGAEKHALLLEDADALHGLPADQVAAAARAARRSGQSAGRYVLSLVSSTSQPALAQLTDRAMRRSLLEHALQRGADNEDRAGQIARLRARQARLLGHATFAAYATQEQTAASPEAVEDMFHRLAAPLIRAAAEERRRLEAAAAHRIEAWDWAYYTARTTGDGGGPAPQELREYFALDAVLADGLFDSARLLYGLTFTERADITAHHPAARIFEVTDKHDRPIGLYLIDTYARQGKRGGAWTGILRPQAHATGARPIVVNTFNLTAPGPGQPCLLNPAEVVTLFHEFGHALHALLSDVSYPAHSAPGVPRDFSEAPAQVHETWAFHPTLLARYARHHATRRPLPDEWIKHLGAGQAPGGVHMLVEILGAAVVDWAWHTRPADARDAWDAAAIEEQAVARWGLDTVPEIPPRYRSGYFDHVFHGPYGAGFYAYLWSEIIAADIADTLDQHGGLTRENGERLRRLLCAGGARDAMAMFTELTGHDQPRIEPFLRRRGL
ncbi:M3 family metallopeptidase [Streptomyces sp. MUSC 14]|uniref:M3 family metallopeptidase n=1 Tax=Streptomyces sp. MUSC 14 TaxID=1354889 RepID=UPI0009A10EB8|nr:M3 family metallopeptidase [Streptomyces sp. MUSC 14]